MPTGPAVQPVPGTDEATQLLPPYHVVLLNDDDHTYQYVVEMLARIFGYSVEKGFLLAREVDTAGRAVVWTGPLEQAEFKRDQIHAYGKDWRIARCAGSMSAIVEPAEG
jgi:ATP-dependent Clp protease adaptor protein ClpS